MLQLHVCRVWPSCLDTPASSTTQSPATGTTTASTTSLVIVAAVVVALVLLVRTTRSVGLLFRQFMPLLSMAWSAMTTIFCTMLISVVVIVALLVRH